MKRAWSFNYCLIASNRFEVHNTCHPKDFCSWLCTDSHGRKQSQKVNTSFLTWLPRTQPLRSLPNSWWLTTPTVHQNTGQLTGHGVGVWPSSITCPVHWTLQNISQRSHASRPEFPDTLTDNTMMAIPGLNSKRIKNSVIYKTGRFTLCLHLCWWDEEKPSKAILGQEIRKPYLSLQLHLSSQPAKKIYLFWILKKFQFTSDLFSQEVIWEKRGNFHAGSNPWGMAKVGFWAEAVQLSGTPLYKNSRLCDWV